jgi:hypothetical protein
MNHNPNSPKKQAPKQGYATPNYTQVPNQLLDDELSNMCVAELKVTLAIIRKIVGFHKTKPEPVSYSQLEKLTGLSRKKVAEGINLALERGNVVLVGHGKRGINLYSINVNQPLTSVPGELVNSSTSVPGELELVSQGDSQKKESKEIKASKKKDSGSEKSSEPRHTPKSEKQSLEPVYKSSQTGLFPEDSESTDLSLETESDKVAPAADGWERLAPPHRRVCSSNKCFGAEVPAQWKCLRNQRSYCDLCYAELTNGVKHNETMKKSLAAIPPKVAPGDMADRVGVYALDHARELEPAVGRGLVCVICGAPGKWQLYERDDKSLQDEFCDGHYQQLVELSKVLDNGQSITPGKTLPEAPAPPKRKRSEKQQRQDRVVDALVAAFDYSAPTKSDYGKLRKVAKELLDTDKITHEDVPALVKFVRQEANEQGGWTVTPTSLMVNGRVGRYVDSRDKEPDREYSPNADKAVWQIKPSGGNDDRY